MCKCLLNIKLRCFWNIHTFGRETCQLFTASAQRFNSKRKTFTTEGNKYLQCGKSFTLGGNLEVNLLVEVIFCGLFCQKKNYVHTSGVDGRFLETVERCIERKVKWFHTTKSDKEVEVINILATFNDLGRKLP